MPAVGRFEVGEPLLVLVLEFVVRDGDGLGEIVERERGDLEAPQLRRPEAFGMLVVEIGQILLAGLADIRRG